MQHRKKSSFVMNIKKTESATNKTSIMTPFDSNSNISDYYLEPDYNTFRQIDYYWLFDKELQFSRRKGFCIEEDLPP